MILSVSRRTDIPAFYSEWFMNRIREGFVYVRNPFNYNQVSSVPLSSNNVDCIVFWTKDARPMMKYLDELDKRGYKYYFQYTITGYNTDIEPFADKKREIIENFIELSNKIGKEKVILRYDPILLSSKYNKEYHFKVFERLCQQLSNYTERVVFSYLDDYKKVSRNMKTLDIKEITSDDMVLIAKNLSNIASENGLILETCAEKISLEEFNIKHSSCIDGNLIERIIKSDLMFNSKNKFVLDNNREACGCVKCIDIGEYDTCIHDCLYCYANVNKEKTKERFKSHDKSSPILVGDLDNAVIKERNKNDTKSFKVSIQEELQESFFENL